MIQLGTIHSRNSFGKLLNDMSLTGYAAEIGTHRGEFAEIFLSTWKGKQLECIDPWSIPKGYEMQASMLWGTGDRRNDYNVALAISQKVNGRMTLMMGTSEEIHKTHKPADCKYDFIYIDGNHETYYVQQDLNLWYPKLKSGGIMAGHDFICPGEINGGWGRGIQKAVTTFAAYYELDIYLVQEDGLPWSFYMIKP